MKRIVLVLFYLSIIYGINLEGQSYVLNLRIIDFNTNSPVVNVNVFIANTTFGTVSSNSGVIQLLIPDKIKEDLIISHLGYDSKVLNYEDYINLEKGDSVFIYPGAIDLKEIVISSKKSDKRKNNFKRFYKAFLGNDNVSDQFEILNPEVLQFIEENDNLHVTAIGPLIINNKYLGYEIIYTLNYLSISSDGSTEYLGKAFYKDIYEGNVDKRIVKNRESTRLKSPKYFFKSLIDDKLEEHGFLVEIAVYRNGQFDIVLTPSRGQLIRKSNNGAYYELYFQEFLKITDKNHKSIDYVNTGVRPGGLESQKFGSIPREQEAQLSYSTSYLYKITPYLMINEFGNILNTKKVKEYGVWADQRFAYQLPFNYGNDYSNEISSSNNHQRKGSDGIKSDLDNEQKRDILLSLIYVKEKSKWDNTLKRISDVWEKGFIAPLIEILRLSREDYLNIKINTLLQLKTGNTDINEYYEWLSWLWSKESSYEDYYSDFKGELYKHLDPKFQRYFMSKNTSNSIRIDEVVWGGVVQDGIPPLRYPELISAEEASYLNKDDVVFGIYIDGVAHCYPKKILAWHEFIVDKIGSKNISGVYCTLCGTVIIYNNEHKGKQYELGTSGFLYRSNKLMYDKETQSLWSTIEGKPVIGPLTNKGIELEVLPVITTTWENWKSAHPETKVLSVQTGYNRDYSEGAAYEEYFSNDELMFPVPFSDSRLKNKDEVFIVRTKSYKSDPLAISMKYLRKRKWYQGKIDDARIVVVLDKAGQTKAFKTSNVVFQSFDREQLKDKEGVNWQIEESFLISSEGKKLNRLPAHNIFWFAWINLFPETRLIDL